MPHFADALAAIIGLNGMLSLVIGGFCALALIAVLDILIGIIEDIWTPQS